MRLHTGVAGIMVMAKSSLRDSTFLMGTLGRGRRETEGSRGRIGKPGQTGRQTETGRQACRQTDRQTKTERQRQKGRQTDNMETSR